MARRTTGSGTPARGNLIPLSALAAGTKPPDPPPCDRCTARCCRHVALEIDRPVSPEDHDRIRWFLVHEGIAVWVHEGDWYLEARNPCRKLRADHTCAIYETRPQLCRDYGAPDTGDRCEYFEDELEFELYFDEPEAFEAWSRETLAKRDARLRARREAYRRRSERAREAIA